MTYVRRAQRVLTDHDRRVIRDTWRDRLDMMEQILDLDRQLLDQRDQEDRQNAEAAKLVWPTPEQLQSLAKIRRDIEMIASRRTQLVHDMNSINVRQLAKRFRVSHSQVYYVVHAR
jgi:Mor family transcriptional regulator